MNKQLHPKNETTKKKKSSPIYRKISKKYSPKKKEILQDNFSPYFSPSHNTVNNTKTKHGQR